MAGASEHAGQARARGKSQSLPEQHFAGVEQAHRLVADNDERVALKIAAPPARMEQPQLRHDIAAFAMAAWQA